MTRNKTTPEDESASPETPDYDALARQYLDLWQDQFAAMAADPGTMETMSKMTAAWREATLSFLQGSGPANPFVDFAATVGNKGAPHDSGRENISDNDTSAPAGAAASDGASDRSDGDVDALLRRITDLETRLAALEHNAGLGTKPKKKERTRKPAKRT